MAESPHLTADGLLAARKRIRNRVHQTAVMRSHGLDHMTGARLWFKCENFQKVGAFKFRGAAHVLSLLSDEEKARGVLTHSSGNHAQALALAARQAGVKAWIVMPENAPAVKKAAVLDYGAEVITCPSTLAAREQMSADVQARTGAVFVHPYDDPRIIAGQASVMLEFLEQVNDLEIVIAPVGGGGLLAGTALAAHYFAPALRVWGAEPAGADDAARSLQAGEILPSLDPQTIADGLLTSLGKWNYPILQRYVSKILTVSEAGIVQALRLIWERLKIVVEPSAAVPLAAVLEYPDLFQNHTVGLVLSGGNVDLEKISGWLSS